MKWLFTGLMVFAFMSSWTQAKTLTHIDSLRSKLQTLKPGRARVRAQQDLFYYYLSNDINKALSQAMDGLAEAERAKNDSDICIFSNCAGEAYIYLEKGNEALHYLNQNYQLAQKINFKPEMALALTDMSTVYQNQSDFINAVAYSFKSLAIYQQLKYYRQIAICYYNIGVTYNNNNDYKKAIFYGQKVLTTTKTLKNSDVTPNAYTLMGTASLSLGNREQGRLYFQKALSIYKNEKNDFGRAIILSQLIAAYPGEYNKQVIIAQQAQQLWNKIAPENFYAIYNLGNLGIAYGGLAKHENSNFERTSYFDLSKNYLTKAIGLAKKTNTKAAVIDLTDSLSAINAAMGDYRDAYVNLKNSNALSDSIYSQDTKNKIASLEGKQEMDLKNQQLVIDQLQIIAETRQKWFLVGGLATLLLIAGLIYFQSIQRRRSNSKLLLLNTELDRANNLKTQFFSILNHDLRRPVAGFITLLDLRENEPLTISGDNQSVFLKSLIHSTEQLLGIMEDLLLWSKGQMENFKPRIQPVSIQEMFFYIDTMFADAAAKFKFESTPGLSVNTDEHYLKSIMQNLTGNAVSATRGTKAPLIKWNAWRTNTALNLSIRDNGPGVTGNQLQPLFDNNISVGIKNGLGLHIVRDLAKSIGCKLTVESHTEGVEIILSFDDAG